MTRDLFGHNPRPAARQRRARRAAHAGDTPVPTGAPPAPATRDHLIDAQRPGVPAAAVESFRALRASVCLSSPAQEDLWLVGAYTDEPRPEISAADLVRLVAALQVFPGARVTQFRNLHVNAPTSASASAPSSWASTEARNG